MGPVILLPPIMVALICGKAFFTGHGPTGQGVTTIYNYACMLSPLLVIYTLVAAFFLMRRRSPKWIKATEATISIVLLVPLSKTAFFAFVLWAMALAPRGPGFP
jgi:hypothetical protein